MLVLDASIAIKWVLPEPYSNEAQQLYYDAVLAGELLLAPALQPIEVANILRQRMRRQQLPLPDALRLYDHYLAFAITFIADSRLARRAIELADQLQLPAVYDAYYLALAESEGTILWTADDRLVRSSSALGFVVGLATYSGNPTP